MQLSNLMSDSNLIDFLEQMLASQRKAKLKEKTSNVDDKLLTIMNMPLFASMDQQKYNAIH